jgi:hypothetical protein
MPDPHADVIDAIDDDLVVGFSPDREGLQFLAHSR